MPYQAVQLFSPCGRHGSAIEMGPKTHRRHGPNNKHIKSITRPGWRVCVTWIGGYMEEELQELCVLQWLDFCARLSDCIFARLLCLFSGYFFFASLASSELATYDFPSRQKAKRPKKKKERRRKGPNRHSHRGGTPTSLVLTFTALIKCSAPKHLSIFCN